MIPAHHAKHFQPDTLVVDSADVLAALAEKDAAIAELVETLSEVASDLPKYWNLPRLLAVVAKHKEPK